jgi:hypothetical protein
MGFSRHEGRSGASGLHAALAERYADRFVGTLCRELLDNAIMLGTREPRDSWKAFPSRAAPVSVRSKSRFVI